MAAKVSGTPWPADGSILQAAGSEATPFSVYVHVPFCDVRCGYCDFNTYVSDFGPGADRATYADSVVREIEFSGSVLDSQGIAARPARSVFFGGGTPSLLAPADIGRMMDSLRATHGLEPGAEVTLEANPDTVTRQRMEQYAEAGVNRVSIGMQSAVPHVLAALDRTHSPESVPAAVQHARDAGMSVSLDLIYGAPGEALEDWEHTVGEALNLQPDHVSAYSLIIEEGTKMGRDLRRGLIPEPDADLEADKYELLDAMVGQAGLHWYEISNFARSPEHQSVHNLAYWQDWDWWGYGPGAHSHIGGSRWWNVAHPTAYAGRVRQGVSPGLAGETLSQQDRDFERLMLGIRTSRGVAAGSTGIEAEPSRVNELVTDGLLDRELWEAGRLVPTLHGRLLADYVTRVLAGW